MIRKLWFSVLFLGPLVALASDEYSTEEIIKIAQDYGIDPAPLLVSGDVDYGAYLSGECTSCHQASGDYDGIPSITHWEEVYFKVAMHEYKQQTRENPVMQMVAGRLGDEEIAALAAYFAQIED
ncbi:MAG: c-type cytochrome [Pseudomonadota bacterium]